MFRNRHIFYHGVGGAKPPYMSKNLLKYVHSLAFIPYLAFGTPVASLSNIIPALKHEAAVVRKVEVKDSDRLKKAQAIDSYFEKRDMPLAGFGMKMVLEAEQNGLDWRLLPAIAVRESSGGKQACDNNPFGWASCKVSFESYDDAIDVIATNLGGNNPKTKSYYSGDTKEKLYRYNGTVIPTYVDEVIAIMDSIGTGDSTLAVNS